MNAVFREAFLLYPWRKSFMPACLHLVYGILSKPSPMEEAEETNEEINSLRPDTGSTVLPSATAFIASSASGRAKKKPVGQGPLLQSFYSIWFLSSFFLGHWSSCLQLITYNNNNCYYRLNVCQALILFHLMSIANCKVGSDET